MIKSIVIIVLILSAGYSVAQQDHQFTQFTYTKLNYNPGVAAINDQISIVGRHRNQWSGLNGAPQAQSILVNLPLNAKSIGFGVALNRATIGINSLSDLTAMYAYKLRLQNAYVSLGLQASIRQFTNDFTKEGLIAIDGFDPDPTINEARFTTNLYNLGIGAYIESDHYYLGLSLPRSIKNSTSDTGNSMGSTEVRHLYGMLGFRFKLSNTWDTAPHLLLKLAENAPYDLDIQNNFTYKEQVTLGINIRAGGTQKSLMESMAFLIGLQFTDNIFASMSYDFNTTTLRQYEEGSFEILMRYTIAKDKAPRVIQNPRYY